MPLRVPTWANRDAPVPISHPTSEGVSSMRAFRTDSSAPQKKLALARRELAAALIERDPEVDLVLTALVARGHALLVSPPGCAKSLLLDSLLAWAGGTRFSILLTKFSVPEE